MTFSDTLSRLAQRVKLRPNNSARRATERRRDCRILSVENLEERRLLTVGLEGVPDWLDVGPESILNGQIENVPGTNPVIGAVHALLPDPTDSDTVYLGTVNGGVWKSTDFTNASPTYTPLTDQFASTSIGALTFDPTDATNNTIYAGIGNSSSFNSTLGLLSTPLTGLLKTTDGGTNWSQVGSTEPSVTSLAGLNITGVEARGNTIVVTGRNFGGSTKLGGVYLSLDGGSSFSFLSGTGGLGINQAFDLISDPTDVNRLYVSLGINGIYRTDNLGTAWTPISAGDAAITGAIAGANNAEMSLSPVNGRLYLGVLQSGQPNYIGFIDNPDAATSVSTWTEMDLPIILNNALTVANATNASPIVIRTTVNHGLQAGDLVRVAGVGGNTAANGEFTVALFANDPDGVGPQTVANSFMLVGSAGNGAYTAGGTVQELTGLNPKLKPGGQGANHFSIVADPNSANIVYVGGDVQPGPRPNPIGATTGSGSLFRGDTSVAATAPGANNNEFSPQWEHLTHTQNAGFAGGGTASMSSPHADSRDMAFRADGQLIEVDDGGIYLRTSPSDNTGDWFSKIGTDLQITEMHSIAYDNNSSIIISGHQDTGTAQEVTTGNPVWTQVPLLGGGFSVADGGKVAVDNLIGGGFSLRYSSFQNFSGARVQIYNAANALIGETTLALVTGVANLTVQSQFYTPIEINEVVGGRLIIGGANGAFESTDGGATVTQVSTTVVNRNDAIAYGASKDGVDNPDALYVGTGAAVLGRTTGATFTALAPTAALPFGATTVLGLEMDPDDWMRVYAIDRNQVFFSPDAGTTWSDITGSLVETNLRSIQYIPATDGGSDVLLVGGATGVLRMILDDPSQFGIWTELGAGLPNSVAYDMDYDAVDDLLTVGTLGRGAWQLEDVSLVANDVGTLLICGDEDFVNQDDVIRLVRNDANPTMLDVYINNNTNTPDASFNLFTISQINVFGVGGNDELIVDTTNGLISVPDGIRYDGDGICFDDEGHAGDAGVNRGIDLLTIFTDDTSIFNTSEEVAVGALPGTGRHTLTGTVNAQAVTQTVWFEELEPVTTNVAAVSFTITSIPGLASLLQDDNQINYTPGQLLPTGGRITIDNFEPIEFENKTDVTVDAGAGNDFVFVNNSVHPTGLETLTFNLGDGHDQFDAVAVPVTGINPGDFMSVTVNGDTGDDLLDASEVFTTTPFNLNGGQGADILRGGPGNDNLDGGDDDDVLIGGDPTRGSLAIGDNTYDGGAGFDTVVVLGTSDDDVITVDQTSATAMTASLNGSTASESFSIATVEQVSIEPGEGDDVIGINVDDSLVANPNNSFRFRVIGDAPNASDRLIVRDDGLGDLVIHREGTDGRSGSITVGPLQPVVYTGIESIDVTPLNSVTGGTGTDGLGRLIVFSPDPLEQNDTREVATFLGSQPTFLQDLTIDPGPVILPAPFGAIPGDQDWFEFRPDKIGTFRFEVLFEEIETLANGRAGLPTNGDIDISVYEDSGTFIAGSFSVTDDESVDISMAAHTSYFLLVDGFSNAINVYDVLVSEVDLVGATVNDVSITGSPYDLFDPKPSVDGPTPPITSLTISLEDTPPRAPGDPYPALDQTVAQNPGHYLLVGDHNGVIPIASVIVTNAAPVAGLTATATIELQFAQPLPDDRFTLTFSDSILDPAGNELDGENNAIEPQESPQFPTGDGIAGGDFVARFTVDSRPEIGVWNGGSVLVDINGNFFFDTTNTDQSNRDFIYQFGLASDDIFAGNFADPQLVAPADGFDKLGAYGQFAGQYRFLIDFDNDGTPDPLPPQAAGSILLSINGLPVAGNFDGNADNGDEVGVFTGLDWYFDTDRDFRITDLDDTLLASQLVGLPIVGDFNNDGLDDLGTWSDDTFMFRLATAATTFDPIDPANTFRFGFPGAQERPIAADFDLDGFEDVGLWVPQRATGVPEEVSEWHILISNGAPIFDRIVLGELGQEIQFSPQPLGPDLFAQLGDEFALPVVGNFDPPLSPSPTPDAEVTGRHIFYENSFFDDPDGNGGQTGAGANASDDGAIAPDKNALLPGETANFGNYTSSSRGINGIMVDIANLASVPTVGDFLFKVGNDNDPDNWALAPAPLSVTVRPGAGVGSSDRVTIIWADNAIEKQWLQVTVLANTNTGLATPDVHYWGNAPGESGNSSTDAIVNLTDVIRTRNNQTGFGVADINNPFDYTRDHRVNLSDVILARNEQSGFSPLNLFAVPAPIAPVDSSAESSESLSEPSTIEAPVVEPPTASISPASVAEPEPVASVEPASGTTTSNTNRIAQFVQQQGRVQTVSPGTNASTSGADLANSRLEVATAQEQGDSQSGPTESNQSDIFDEFAQNRGHRSIFWLGYLNDEESKDLYPLNWRGLRHRTDHDGLTEEILTDIAEINLRHRRLITS